MSQGQAPDPRFLLLVFAIFLALELPLAVMVVRATRRLRSLLVPTILFVLAALVPNPTAKGLLLFTSLLTMFGFAIGTRARRTRLEDERLLASHGRSPWLSQSRGCSIGLIAAGTAMMVAGIVAEGLHARLIALLIFGPGSLMVGLGLLRRHTVLVAYFGRSRAWWLEVVQVGTGLAAYGLGLAGDLSPEADRRLALWSLSLVPFAVHFVAIWLPLARAHERQSLPDSRLDR